MINAVDIESDAKRCYISGVFRAFVVLVSVFGLAFASCARVPTDATPDGALRLFLEAMGRAEDDPSAREQAFALLAPETRRRLTERAKLASSLNSRRFEPWEIIAEGRYRLRFSPREVGGFTSRISNDRAIVVVRGERAAERAEVPMVREANGRWRVFLSIPQGPVARPLPQHDQLPRDGGSTE